MKKEFKFALSSTILSLIFSLLCFYSYFSYRKEELIQINGKFLKIENVSPDYHLFLENYPNLKFEITSIVVEKFMLGRFEREVKKGTILKLMVSKEDFINPRNGVQESRKNQISIYEIEGPTNVYLSKNDSFSSMHFHNKIMSPALGVLFFFLSLYCFKQYFNNRNRYKFLEI